MAPQEAVTPEVESAQVAPTFELDTSTEDGIALAAINRRRLAEGLPPVEYSPALSAVAQEQALWLTDYQDTELLRQPGFGINNEQAVIDRASAWAVANVLDGIDTASRLPAGWSEWQDFPTRLRLHAVSSDEAALGNFTHVGFGSTRGEVAHANVVLFANYPTEGPDR